MIFFFGDTTHFSQIVLGHRNRVCIIYLVGNKLTIFLTFRYNSGGKSFTEVTSTKHLSVSIDAVVLMNSFWKSKATPAAKR
jgi:hypothetical protein